MNKKEKELKLKERKLDEEIRRLSVLLETTTSSTFSRNIEKAIKILEKEIAKIRKERVYI